jgi:hypothetical protein
VFLQFGDWFWKRANCKTQLLYLLFFSTTLSKEINKKKKHQAREQEKKKRKDKVLTKRPHPKVQNAQ